MTLSYRMAPMTMSDLEGHFSCLKTFLNLVHWKIYQVIARVCSHTNWKVYVWSIILAVMSRKEDLCLLRSQTVRYTVKVVISRKRCKIERLLPYRPQYCPNGVRVVPFHVILSDILCHSPIASLFICNFSCSYAEVD